MSVNDAKSQNIGIILNLDYVMQASFGPIGWLMISEIFPLRTRARGLSIAVLVNFAANALVTFSFSPLRVNTFCEVSLQKLLLF